MLNLFYKKGELEIQTVIIAILCLLVLIVLVFMFRQQIAQLGQGFMNLISGATDSTKDINETIKNIVK